MNILVIPPPNIKNPHTPKANIASKNWYILLVYKLIIKLQDNFALGKSFWNKKPRMFKINYFIFCFSKKFTFWFPRILHKPLWSLDFNLGTIFTLLANTHRNGIGTHVLNKLLSRFYRLFVLSILTNPGIAGFESM